MTLKQEASTRRRDLIKLMGLGGVAYASSLFPGLVGCSSTDTKGSVANNGRARGADQDFFFLQLSDTHWGFSGDMVNPEATITLPNAIAAINASSVKPDFVVFTGDLTHTTDDGDLRRKRMQEFKTLVQGLAVPSVRFLPGEHDAAPDAGAAYSEFFGELHYSFDHKGIHFVALDNVSDPSAKLGQAQLDWLVSDLGMFDVDAPIVVFAHRPLWDLRPDWDWATPDGAQAIEILQRYNNVTVFFGHIHQTNHHMTSHIAHHSTTSLMFALPAPESTGMRVPVPWDPAHPDAGLGYRTVEARTTALDYEITEVPLQHASNP